MKKIPYKISLAEWSLHPSIYGDLWTSMDWVELHETIRNNEPAAKKVYQNHLNFPKIAREQYGLDAVEYVNNFFLGKAEDTQYLTELKNRADDAGVKSLLIMCGNEGDVVNPKPELREKAIQNHVKWIKAAKFLGCHSIRVNTKGHKGREEEDQKIAADSVFKLAEIGDNFDINILLEPHGGISGQGEWLLGVVKQANHPRVGILNDFANIDPHPDYYKWLKEMMPYSKAINARTADYTQKKDGVEFDFERVLRIIVDSGYIGYIGIESKADQIANIKKRLESFQSDWV
jgi:sugar phosphate isomerase/epimerase